MNILNVSNMAIKLGVHPQTIRRWSRNGSLPESFRTVGNHRRYEIKAPQNGAVVGYARVSSHDQKNDLLTQQEALLNKAAERGIEIDEVITDIGSGMNCKKKGFLRLMGMILSGQLSHLVLLHKDRLLRFGGEIVFLVCKAMGVTVTVLEESPATSPMEILACDLIEIITVFSSKLYGMRSHINRTNKRNAQVCSTILPTV